ncbi:ATP-dependent RNA helicase mak5 [Aspergillus varians]
MGQKRQRDLKGPDPQTKKQKRAAKPKSATEKQPEPEVVVGVDDLNWKEVGLPDRLDDFEGFFGLEEIDGVDIVRPQGKGELRFKSVKPEKSILKKSEPKPEDDEFDDEWSGFSEGESGDQDGASTAKKDPKPAKLNDKKGEETKKKEAKTKDPKTKEPKKKSKEQKEKGGAKAQDSNITSGLSFAALEDEADDEGVDISAWEQLGLSTETLTSLSKMKFGTPTAVQKSCIPPILDGHDVIGKASTGSGKTLAFGLPILEHYIEQERKKRKGEADKKKKVPIALILSPTRELAHQLQKHIYTLISNAPGVNARTALLTGGLSVQKQQRLLETADIVIGTPGRAWEVLRSGQGLIRRMQGIKFLVIDEADRLLSEGHFREVADILGSLDRVEDGDIPDEGDSPSGEEDVEPGSQRQTLVFSATFHRDLQQKLAGKAQWTGGDVMSQKESMEYLLKKLNFKEEKPKFIDVNPVSQMATGLKEGIVECPAMEKDLYLYTLLLYHPKYRTLVFTNSISAVRRITQLLQNLQLPALGLHSSMAQKARLRSIERFSSPTADPGTILVATDVAARGLDVKGIDFVIHYHAPRAADTYVHRSGRTARAGASGKSVIICSPEEMVGVIRMAAKVHAKMANGKRLALESLELDRRIISRVRERVILAARITDSNIAKEKITTEDNWLRNAAEELGVDYNSDEFDQAEGWGRGRGRGRQERDREVGSTSKAELAGIRAELKDLLSQRINIGVSERYLTSERVDIEALLRGENNDSFLGQVDPLGF